jgi:hypothetical protein
MTTLVLSFCYFVRIKTFRRLLPEDYLIDFDWILLLTTRVLWQFIVPDLYKLMEVTARCAFRV